MRLSRKYGGSALFEKSAKQDNRRDRVTMPVSDNLVSPEPENGEGESIQVFVRVRPLDGLQNEFHSKVLEVNEDCRSVTMNCKPEPKHFTFDHIVDVDSTQEAVFATVGKKLIESCVSGYNGTIFAYGQTGSGKTFTMLGPSENADNFQHELRGIIPRSFEYLFNLINREKELNGDRMEFFCHCSFLEIYNEQIYDLLDPASPILQLRESMKKQVYVDRLFEQVVSTAGEAYQVLNAGWLNRRVASTSMNRQSSRSHAVFSLHIKSEVQNGEILNVKTSQLNLVDLAGSERQKDTNTDGARLKEAGNINRSLSTLGNVIMALGTLTNGRNRYIPYRDSKLTFLLRDSLGGNAQTHIIACVHSSVRCFGETLSTLNFARRAKLIKNRAVCNEDAQGNVTALQEEICRLKEVLNHYKNSSIIQDVSNFDLQRCPEKCTSDVWKQRFVNSMFFWQISEQQKKELHDVIANFKELYKKNEKFILSNKMIIKFRENHIARLERAAMLPLSEENASYVDDLKEEIQHLQQQLDHHPLVAKYLSEIQYLEQELRVLKKQQDFVLNAEKIEELEQMYLDHLAEKKKEDSIREKINNFCSPKSPSKVQQTREKIDKYKTQVGNLQEEIVTLKGKLAEQKEMAEKKELMLDAEVSASKKMIVELEQVLEAQQLKSKIQRENMNDLHVQTIKTMSSPTKSTLEQRCLVDVPEVKKSSYDAELEAHDVDNDEQSNEGLMEEIKYLQAEVENLVQKSESSETEIMKLRQELSKWEHQCEQLQGILNRERSEWADKEDRLTKQYTEMTEELANEKENNKFHQGEAIDLKLLLQSADKELTQAKKKLTQAESSKQKEVAALETKLIQLEDISKNHQELTEANELLQDSLESAQATALFNEEGYQTLEKLYVQEKEKVKNLENQLKSALENLIHEKECNENLKKQIENTGNIERRELLHVMTELNVLRDDHSSLQNVCDAHMETIALLKKEKEIANETVLKQQRELEKNKEAMTGLLTNLREVKEKFVAKDVKMVALRCQLEDMVHQHSEQEAILEEHNKSIMFLKKQLDDFLQEKHQENQEHNVEVSILKDEIDSVMENNGKQREELQAMQEQLEKVKVTHSNEIRRLTELQKEKLQSMETKVASEQELSQMVELQMLEINKYKNKENKLIKSLEEYEVGRKAKNEDILILKDELFQKETDAKMFKEENEKLKSELYTNKLCIAQLREEVEKLNNEIQLQKNIIHKDNQISKQENVEKEVLKNKLAWFENQNRETKKTIEQLLDDVKRLRTVAGKDQEEKQDLHSQLEKLKEENSKSQKEYNAAMENLNVVQEQNAKLVGHQNQKQRIHYHQVLKEENIRLKNELIKIQAELCRLKDPGNCPDTALKENVKK